VSIGLVSVSERSRIAIGSRWDVVGRIPIGIDRSSMSVDRSQLPDSVVGS
jgi:hypothetical protein